MVLYGAQFAGIDVVHALRHHRAGRVLVLDDAAGARLQRQAREIDARRHDALVVVWVYTYGIALQVERKLAILDVL